MEYKAPLSLSLEELKEKQCLYIDNINYGFDKLDYYYIESGEQELKNFLLNKIAENGIENSYVDFYYGRLSDKEKDKVHSVLNVSEVNYLKSIKWNRSDIFFKLDSMIFEITFKLSISEMLFSTFYFSKFPITIWSNYNRKFVVFHV